MAKSRKLTEAQEVLAIHLAELGLFPEFEVPVCEGRRYRFDVACKAERLAFECNGHWHGTHGRAWSQGAEKINIAQMLGWRVLVFHNRDVLYGRAKAFLMEWMGR